MNVAIGKKKSTCINCFSIIVITYIYISSKDKISHTLSAQIKAGKFDKSDCHRRLVNCLSQLKCQFYRSTNSIKICYDHSTANHCSIILF